MSRLSFDLRALGHDSHVYSLDDDGHREELTGIQGVVIASQYDDITRIYLRAIPLPIDDSVPLEIEGSIIEVPNWPPSYYPGVSRRFHLERDSDVSGVSGTGVVAMGWDLGVPTHPGGPNICVLHWFGTFGTTVIHHAGLDSVQGIHGHDGRTRVVYDD